jgi:hypothetical protein
MNTAAGADNTIVMSDRTADPQYTLSQPPAPEVLTAAVLAQLADRGWDSVHHVPAPYGHYDHIALGPGGVVLIESVRLAPEAALDPELRTHLLADARVVRERLSALAGRRTWVQSMIVVWGPEDAGCVIDGRCVVLDGSRLSRWLERRPSQLTAGDLGPLFAAVQQLAAGSESAAAAA